MTIKIHKINQKILIFITIISTVFAMVFSVFQSYSQYKEDLQSHTKVVSQFKQTHLPQLIHSAWELDSTAISNTIKGIKNYNFISYVEVNLSTDTNIIGKGEYKEGNPITKDVISQEFPLFHYEEGQPILLGHLNVLSSRGEILEVSKKQLIKSVISDLIKTLFLGLSFLIFFRLLVIQYIKRASSFIRQLKSEQLTKPFDLTRKQYILGGEDEITQLLAGIEEMRVRLKSDFENEKSNQANLNELNQQLEKQQKEIKNHSFQLEKKAQESNSRLHGVLESIQQGILIIDHNLVIQPEFSPYLKELFPYTMLASKGFMNSIAEKLEFPTPNERITFKQNLEDLLKNDLSYYDNNIENLPREVRLINEETILEVDWQPLYNNENEVTHLTIIFRDVTEVRNSQSQLETTQAIAEKANLGKSQLLSSISHQIRTPMNAIVGMSDLLASNNPSQEFLEPLNIIQNSSRNLLNIINDLVDFSGGDSQDILLESTHFNLHQVVNEVLDTLILDAQNKNIEFSCFIHPLVSYHLIGDDNRLLQVLINLCTNAIQHTSQGKVSLKIKLIDNHSNSQYISFEVEDSGEGLSTTERTKIHENINGNQDSSSGLGLIISQNILKAMNSEIEIKSEETLGSTFSFKANLSKQVLSNPPINLRNFNLKSKKVILVGHPSQAIENLTVQLQYWDASINTIESDKKLEFFNANISKLNSNYIVILFLSEGDLKHESSLRELQKNNDFNQTLVISEITNHSHLLSNFTRSNYDLITRPIKMFNIFEALCKFEKIKDHEIIESQIHTHCEYTALKVDSKILIVDDNPINLKVLNKTLQALKLFNVVQANDGAVAVEKAKQEDFDIILMDYQMPLLDGIQATKEIRKIKGDDQVKIIALTAKVMREDREECLKAGMNDFITKPLQIEELRKVLSNWM